MYFHTDDPAVLQQLLIATSRAVADGSRIRLDVDAIGNLRYKVGGGMWSAPIASTFDPYRG